MRFQLEIDFIINIRVDIQILVHNMIYILQIYTSPQLSILPIRNIENNVHGIIRELYKLFLSLIL